jgi:hypothetical protein
MAFTIANWTCYSSSLNQGQESVVPFGESVAVMLNAPNLFIYGSPNDTAAQIGAANYFLPQYRSLNVGDWIFGYGTDTSFALQVTAVSSTSVTTESVGLTTSIGTANLVDHAVTYVKMQEASALVLLGNPTGGLADVSEITLDPTLEFDGTALKVAEVMQNYVEVEMSAANWNGMYAAPFQVAAAPGANKMILVQQCAISFFWGTTEFTGGGVVGLQYGTDAQLLGAPASNTQAAADITSANTSRVFLLDGSLDTGAVLTDAVNAGVYISNATAAFAAGDSTFKVKLWYAVISTT